MGTPMISEEKLLKALAGLEKATDEMPDDTDEANGGEGLEQVDNEDKEHTEVKAGKGEPVAKADEKDDESEESEDESSEEDASKSFIDKAMEDPTVMKAVEASDFLEAFLQKAGEHFDMLAKSDDAIAGAVDSLFESEIKPMQKALVAMGNLLLDIKKSLDAFGGQPSRPGPKSVTSIVKGGAVVERFPTQFSKSDVLDALCNLAEKGEAPHTAVSEYETVGTMDPEVKRRVDSYLSRR